MSIIITLMHWARKPVEYRKGLSVGISIEVIILSLIHANSSGSRLKLISFGGSFRVELTG